VRERTLSEEDWKLTLSVEVKRFADSVLCMSYIAEEVFYVLAVRSSMQVMGVFLLSKGTVICTLVGVREVFERLLLLGAVGFIVLHNHPSGNPVPSEFDQKITRRLKEAADLMGLILYDHVIVGQLGYYSFKENMTEYWKEEKSDGCMVV